ncbi:MAG: hypothetical protein JWN73_4333 [Betaproteobacteria bacterium]|nr:hypothetical protein [Betaproteobacteria bacterium]
MGVGATAAAGVMMREAHAPANAPTGEAYAAADALMREAHAPAPRARRQWLAPARGMWRRALLRSLRGVPRAAPLGALLCAAVLALAPPAQADVLVPPLTGHVTDQTGTLTGDQKASLEATLTAFEAKKGSQIAVLLVPTTAPETIEQFSIRVVDKWKLGRKKVDDGALLLIAKNDRSMRIEVGYGLEGALNDATAKRIIAETITPSFKQGDFYGGIKAGVDSMIGVVNGEPLPPPTQSGQGASGSTGNGGAGDGGGLDGYVTVLFILAVVVGGVLRSLFGRFPGALVTGGLTGVLAFFFLGGLGIAIVAGGIALVVTLFGGGIGSMLGGYGGGGRGGGGGGGFSGGRGGFGGGGASGKW